MVTHFIINAQQIAQTIIETAQSAEIEHKWIKIFNIGPGDVTVFNKDGNQRTTLKSCNFVVVRGRQIEIQQIDQKEAYGYCEFL